MGAGRTAQDLGRVGRGVGGVGSHLAGLPTLLTPLPFLQRCFQTTNGYLSDSRPCSSSYNVAALATSSLMGELRLLLLPHAPAQCPVATGGGKVRAELQLEGLQPCWMHEFLKARLHAGLCRAWGSCPRGLVAGLS